MRDLCTSSAMTHTGTRRRLNEDAYLDRPDLGLWAVADGMGGHKAGDYASQRVVESLDFAEPSETPRDLLTRIEAALGATNDDLIAKADGLGPKAVVASTVVGLVVAGLRFACFWAGDSRLYMIRGGEILQLTRDDSHVQDLVDAGELGEQEADGHPLAHVVTAAVGADRTFHLNLRHGRMTTGDRFLLCSDGLSRMLSAAEVSRIVTAYAISEAAQTLVEEAVSRGARDNVTAIVIGRGADEVRKEGGGEKAPWPGSGDEPDTLPGSGSGSRMNKPDGTA